LNNHSKPFKNMSYKLISTVVLVWLTAGFLYFALDEDAAAGATMLAVPHTMELVLPGRVAEEKPLTARGKYLVTIMGCNDCHSPKKFGPQGPVPDPERLLSGHPSDSPLPTVDKTRIGPWLWFNDQSTAFVGPWGASFAANLTPDATGIGNWSEEQFKKAMQQGKYKGLDNSRPLLPPMPWPAYRQLADQDLKAIFAYLRSLKPVKNIPPPPRALQDLP
jgi:hypothetical protein